jgi:putative membrane protein
MTQKWIGGVAVMFWYDHNMSWWGYAGMGIGMVLFWALLIVGIVALIRFSTTTPDRSQPLPRPSPEQVLADRFARGEISETEYRDRLAVLGDNARR